MNDAAVDSVSALEQVLELSPTVLFHERADRSFAYLSPNIERYSGVPAAEWLRRPDLLGELLYEPDAPVLRENRERALARPEPQRVVFRIRNRRTGRFTAFCEVLRAIPGAKGFHGSWTEWNPNGSSPKLLDDLAWQRAFGFLTMGAAHDINNKLTGITSLSDMYLLEAGPNSPMFDGLSAIRSSGYSIGQLLQQLAAQQQATPGRRELADINEVVQTITALLRRCISSHVNLETSASSEPLSAVIDRVALQRVLMILAMESGMPTSKVGLITITNSRIERDGMSWIRIEMAATVRESSSLTGSARPAAGIELAERFALGHGGRAETRDIPGGRSIVITLPMADLDKPMAEKPERPWVLLINITQRGVSELIQALESKGVSAVLAGEDWPDQLDRSWFDWHAVLIRVPSSQAPAMAAHARKQKWRTYVWLADDSGLEIDGAEAVFSSNADVDGIARTLTDVLR
jgi:hypothetical protein